MNRSNSCITLLALAAGMVAFPTMAQPAGEIEEITVLAPASETVIGRSTTGARIRLIELTSAVNITDLDLTRVADLQQLDDRIAEAARLACEQLSQISRMERITPMEMGRCVEQAVASADDQRSQAIAQAG